MNSHRIRGYWRSASKDGDRCRCAARIGRARARVLSNAGHVSNRFGIENSVVRNTDIFLCHGLRQSWPPFLAGISVLQLEVSMKGETQRVQQAIGSRFGSDQSNREKQIRCDSENRSTGRGAEIAEKHGVPRGHIALAWLLQKRRLRRLSSRQRRSRVCEVPSAIRL
jgi:hypothetical protein